MKKAIFIIIFFINTFYTLYSSVPDNNANIFDYSKLPVNCIVIFDNLRLRENPDLNSNIIKTLKIGEKFSVLDKTKRFQIIDNEKSFWYKVKSGESTGWLYGAYVLFDYNIINNIIYGLKITPIGYDSSIFKKRI